MSDEKVKGKSLTKQTFMTRLKGDKDDPETAKTKEESDAAKTVPVSASNDEEVSNTLDAILSGQLSGLGKKKAPVVSPDIPDPEDLLDEDPPEPGEPEVNTVNDAEDADDFNIDHVKLNEPDPEMMAELDAVEAKERQEKLEAEAANKAPLAEEISAPKKGLKAISKAPIHNGTDVDEDYERYQSKIRMDAEKARRTMNMLATMGPVFKRVVGNTDSDDAAGLVSDLLRRSEQLQERLYSVFNAQSEKEVPDWLKAKLARYATGMVTENPTMSVDDIVSLSEELAKFPTDIRYEYSSGFDDKTQIKLSMIKAISRIEREVNDFHNRLMEANIIDLAERIESSREAILSEITGFIVDKVGDGLAKLGEPDASRKTKTMMTQSLIGHASDFYLSAISYELSLFWQRRGQSEKKGNLKEFAGNFLARNKLGISADSAKKNAGNAFDDLISATTKEFDKQFNRLISFTYDKINGSIKNV